MLSGYRGFWAAALFLFGATFTGSPATAASYEEGLRAFDGTDYDLALEIWKPLGEAGDALAQYSLGKLFEAGGGAIQQDFGEAQYWYRKAADQGVPAAQNNLALMHAQGRGVQRSVEQAIELWYEAAKSNHPMAQYNLGLAYLRGEGLVKDEREAAAWFRRSADSGLPEAQYAVGQMNRLGLVLPKDAGLALAWYRKAADQDHKEANVQVQILEANGMTPGDIGPPEILPQALKTPAAVAAANAKAKEEAEASAKLLAEAEARAQEEAKVAAAAAESAPPSEEATAGTAPAAEAPTPKAAEAELAVVEPEPLDPDGPAFTAAQSVAVQAAGEAPATDTSTMAAKDEPEPIASKAKPAVQAKSDRQDPEVVLAEAPATTTVIGAPAPSDDPDQASAEPQSAAVVPESEAAGPSVKVWIASATSEDEGLKYWQETKGKHPDLFSGKQGEVAKVDYGQGSTFFRLLAGPVPSREAALELCKELRARDAGAFCKIQKN